MNEPWDDPGPTFQMQLTPVQLEGFRDRARDVVAGVCPYCSAALNDGTCAACESAFTVISLDPLRFTSWYVGA